MGPIFATDADRLSARSPIGRISRALSDHPLINPVLEIAALAALHQTPLHAAEEGPALCPTIGPRSLAVEGADGLLHWCASALPPA